MTQPAPVIQTADERIFRCWRTGMGITDTRKAVRRVCGEDISFEQVRRAFVILSDKFG